MHYTVLLTDGRNRKENGLKRNLVSIELQCDEDKAEREKIDGESHLNNIEIINLT